MAKGMARTTEAIDKMKKEMEDLEAEVGNKLEKLTRAVERVERKGAPTPSPLLMARDMQCEALMRRLNRPPPTTPTDSEASSPAPTWCRYPPPALPRVQQVEAARKQPAAVEGQAATAEAEVNETEGLTEQDMVNRDLGESIRRSRTAVSHVDWSRTEEGGEEETKDVERGEADTIHPERREQIEREESEDTPIPQQPARPLWPVGPGVQDMSVRNLTRQAHKRRSRGRRHPCCPVAGPHHRCRINGHPPCLGASTDLHHIAPVAIFPDCWPVSTSLLCFLYVAYASFSSLLFPVDSACTSFSCLLTYVVSL